MSFSGRPATATRYFKAATQSIFNLTATFTSPVAPHPRIGIWHAIGLFSIGGASCLSLNVVKSRFDELNAMERMTQQITNVDDLRTETLTGTVIAAKVWSETRVHGGAKAESTYVPAGGGHVSTPEVTISSTTTEKLHLFIKRDDGREFDQRFVHAGLGLREGNRVSIVYVPKIGGEPMALVNHDTSKSRIYENRIPGLTTTTYSSAGKKVASTIVSWAILAGFLALAYFGFSGELSGSELLSYSGILIAGWILAILLGPKVPEGLRDRIKATIQQRVDAALAADKSAT